MTLSFLPYAAATPALALQSEEMGHEVLAHVPMEPIGPSDPGPKALKIGATDNAERLAWALARVPGLSGINNHEGSKFSGDAAATTEGIDSVRFRPTWRNQPDLSALTGKLVQLRITLQNARLYAFQIRE